MDAVQEVVDFPFYNLKNPLKVYIKYHFNILSFISSRVSFNLAMNAIINDNNISMLGFFLEAYHIWCCGWAEVYPSCHMVTCMSLCCGGGEPEYLKRAHAGTGRTCRLYAGGADGWWIGTLHLLAVRQQREPLHHCARH